MTDPSVTGTEDQQHNIRYLTELVDGVYSMSADMESLGEKLFE